MKKIVQQPKRCRIFYLSSFMKKRFFCWQSSYARKSILRKVVREFSEAQVNLCFNLNRKVLVLKLTVREAGPLMSTREENWKQGKHKHWLRLLVVVSIPCFISSVEALPDQILYLSSWLVVKKKRKIDYWNTKFFVFKFSFLSSSPSPGGERERERVGNKGDPGTRLISYCIFCWFVYR